MAPLQEGRAKGRDEWWAGQDAAARKEAIARMNEARRRKQQFLPPELLAMVKEVNPRDPGRRTYEASCAWMQCVRAYNERARVTEGWEVVEDVKKAAHAVRIAAGRNHAHNWSACARD